MDLRCYNWLRGAQNGSQGQKSHFGEVSSTKKNMFTSFFIFRIDPYWEILSLTLTTFKTKQPILRFWELSGFIHFLALWIQHSTKFVFKTSPFQFSYLPLNIILDFKNDKYQAYFCFHQHVLWNAGFGMACRLSCYHPCKSRKRSFAQVMKSLP